MTSTPDSGGPDAQSPEELREQVARTREHLGDTVEQLAAKADVTGQAKHKAAELRDRVQQKADRAAHVVQEKTAHVSHTVQEKTPERVRVAAERTGPRTSGAALAAGAAVLLAFLWLRGHRGGKRC
ncbi:DUF3618 domain-containing protein [Streptomyces sp. NPDC017993]|uniref:DUF3618 domain-containing protein n=1 Tax=Streptomyces sp. NPDC017993 TaxID=3365027 RepID=UPI0037919551